MGFVIQTLFDKAVSAYLETGKAAPCSIAIMFKRGETI